MHIQKYKQNVIFNKIYSWQSPVNYTTEPEMQSLKSDLVSLDSLSENCEKEDSTFFKVSLDILQNNFSLQTFRVL